MILCVLECVSKDVIINRIYRIIQKVLLYNTCYVFEHLLITTWQIVNELVKNIRNNGVRLLKIFKSFNQKCV